ncbi:MAG TPA: NAD-dependent epimerase/dehydratase family protein, partial [Bacteroidota bacterium]|nr:NAD-dependent epimerase/dehydratase family protein [Bacteroidota bacterium]
MKYFVTGGTGFIGSRIVRQLVEAGHEVVAIAR